MLTYDQLIKSDASNPEAVKAITALLGVPTGAGANFYSDQTIFKDNLANLQRKIGEQVAGTRGSSPSGEFQKFGEYAAWGGDVTPLQAQLAEVKQKYANAGVDFSSSPLSVLEKIAGLPGATPAGGSRVTSQNYQGGEFGQIALGQNPNSVLPNNNRSLISTSPKTGYIKGYDTNNGYSEVYVPKGLYVPGISATPKQITSSSLQSAGNVSLPGATPSGVDLAGASVAGATTAVGEIMKQLTPPETDAERAQQDTLNKILGLTAEAGNKGTDQINAEQQAGIPELRKQIADINGQIQTKIAEYKALQVNNENRPVTMSSIIGSERAILNAKASDIELLTARANALTGNLEVAQENVNRAIDLKYDTISNKLNIYKSQLAALEPILNKEEKQQALAQNILLKQQEQAIADAKAKEKQQSEVILDLISKYPDAKISFTDSLASAQAKLVNSKIYRQATRLSGGGGGEKSKDTYFTHPKPDGSIGYYFGNSKNVASAQELTPENYYKAKSASEGALVPQETPTETVTNLKNQGYSKGEVEDMGKYPQSVIDSIFTEEDKKSWWKFW